MKSPEWIVRTPHEMSKIACEIIEKISAGDKIHESDGVKATVIGLYGDLGAGKTTFSQAFAKEIGVTETVTSPTFVIEKSYALSVVKDAAPTLFNKLVHIDAYRLNSSHELEVLGWKELLSEPKTLILIEWPERVADIMPPHIKLELSMENEHNRKVVATYI